ncbi:MAG: hypothetical protein ABSG92_08660 [Conexivisphaerales archaeon]
MSVVFRESVFAQTANLSPTGPGTERPDPVDAIRPKKARNPTKKMAMAMYPVLAELSWVV